MFPKKYYQYTDFHNCVSELEGQTERELTRAFDSSGFGFLQTNDLKGTRYLKDLMPTELWEQNNEIFRQSLARVNAEQHQLTEDPKFTGSKMSDLSVTVTDPPKQADIEQTDSYNQQGDDLQEGLLITEEKISPAKKE
jgi:hypothetical protein